MAIRVTHPSGATIEFPDGTDNDSIAEAMGQLDGAAQGSGQAPQDVGRFAQPAIADAEQRPPYSTAGEAITGAGKALGTGLAKGVVGLGTLPGNMEALGRAGINKLAGLAGVEAPVSPDPVLRSAGDVDWSGWHQPKTTAEKYIQTAGEFAPMVLPFGQGGLLARGAQVAAPAVASEAAGQLTEGTDFEPWARLGGAIAGGSVANLGARAVTPFPSEPTRQAAVKTLEKAGVDSISAGQRTGAPMLSWMESAAQTMPGGRRMAQTQQKGAEQFTAAALKTAGVQGTRATSEAIDDAFTQIGKQYEAVGRVANVKADPKFAGRIMTAVRQYQRETPPAQQITAVMDDAQEIVKRASRPQGMTGDEYLGMRSNLKRMQRGLKANPQASRAVGQLVENLDAQMIRTAPKNIRADVKRYIQDMNGKYRNLLALEDAADASGIITPAQLKIAVRKQNRRDYSRGRTDLGRLARAGEQVIKPLPSSGTAERGMAQSVLKAPATLAGGGFGAGGMMMGADPLTSLAMAAAPLAVQAGSTRLLTNPTMQKLLANQTLPGRVATEPGRRSSPLLGPYIMQEYGGQ